MLKNYNNNNNNNNNNSNNNVWKETFQIFRFVYLSKYLMERNWAGPRLKKG